MGVRRLAVAALAAQLALLAFGSNALASDPCPTDTAQPALATAYDTAMAVVCDLNTVRAQYGLRPLTWDWRLWSAAQGQANDMATRHYASHVTPDGKGLRDRIEPTGYIPTGPNVNWLVGENLGWGTGVLSTPNSIVVGWMNSPEHRRNVLEPQFEDIGIGINIGSIGKHGDTGVIYAAEFGMRAVPGNSLLGHAKARRSRRR